MSNMEDKLDRLICERVTVEKGHCRYTATLGHCNNTKLYSLIAKGCGVHVSFDTKDVLEIKNSNPPKIILKEDRQ